MKKLASKIYRSFLGVLTLAALCLNTIIMFIPIVLIGSFKILPIEAVRRACNYLMGYVTTCWISVNAYFVKFTRRIKWTVRGDVNITRDQSYLVISNHQTWLDIVVLQNILHSKIPTMRFFIKDQLKWVPLLGFTWWILDYPFMKRYSKEYLAKNPEKKGQDLAATKKACQKFMHTNVSFTNFIEGTRFSKAKHAIQNSPYKHLLRPKAGGVAYVLQTMEKKISTIIDVTILYPNNNTSLWDYLSGTIQEIKVYIRQLPIPEQYLKMNYFEDADMKQKFQDWLNQQWHEKDEILDDLNDRLIETN